MDSDYLEKFKAQTEAISISLAMNQARCGASSSVPTLPPTTVDSGSSNAAPPPVISTPPALAVDGDAVDAPSKSITLTVRILINHFCLDTLISTLYNSVPARIRRAIDHYPLTRRIPCAINVGCVLRSIRRRRKSDSNWNLASPFLLAIPSVKKSRVRVRAWVRAW